MGRTMKIKEEPVKHRNQANARERDRTHSVNKAFSTLRALIPTEPPDRKLSKIETLRLASSYIDHLASQLTAESINQSCHMIQNPNLSIWKDGRMPVCTFCLTGQVKKIQTDEIIQDININLVQPLQMCDSLIY